jgi:hypothetical protein
MRSLKQQEEEAQVSLCMAVHISNASPKRAFTVRPLLKSWVNLVVVPLMLGENPKIPCRVGEGQHP